ncbi:guided entry of tail-anchored proteins factor 1 [Uranotaenia lowii]|uniref:guided entry of tail-anchored proteins factor 1 n=1 Tax=Uranotaenia lowii TaxID=190385 RepID=UPI0024787751|nr:guided entry of tail-anchored proteins factor 1 [Uranotaenia lowii]
MFLLFAITIICFLLAFTARATNFIVDLVIRDSPETRALRAESELTRRELSRISMRDDYINYVKVERKLVAIDAKLNESKSRDAMRRKIYEYGFQYGTYALASLGLVIISIGYRYQPVVVFGDGFNFEPFGKALSFPTGVSNSVSPVCWIVVNNLVARAIAGYLK